MTAAEAKVAELDSQLAAATAPNDTMQDAHGYDYSPSAKADEYLSMIIDCRMQDYVDGRRAKA